MIVGMDFGTTNSGMAVYDGRQLQLLPLDPANANPHVIRTALYITNDQKLTIGREAVDHYFEQNVGRAVRMERVWVGEIEVYGADMYYVTDVYVWADVLSPGRLFLSIKSGLREVDYQGTVIGHFYYSLENLIAAYLSLTKIRAERLLGQPLNQVVLGRPVRFSTDPLADQLAQNRLLDAAFQAGYEKVYLQREPIAAAYHYAIQQEEPQNILVFDFGGGTLDITVMRLEGTQRRVLATGGLPVAGDLFDQKIVRGKLPYHFGEGATYGPPHKKLPLPKWLFELFSDWQKIIELQSPKRRKRLREIARTSDRRPQLEALLNLVSNNYSLQMFDLVEQAKRQLSTKMATMIRLEGPGFNIVDSITRPEFERLIQAEINAIEQHLEETIQASGLAKEQFDAVIHTGGSSRIPVFQQMLTRKFGRAQVKAVDTFSSVTSGLGIIGQAIENGQLEIKAYTPADLPQRQRAEAKARVPTINLALLKRQMVAQEEEDEAQDGRSPHTLIILTRGSRLALHPLPTEPFEQTLPFPDPPLTKHDQINQALITSLDEPLLLATSAYRFLRTTPRQLLDLEELGMSLKEFFHLKKDEYLCACAPWEPIRTCDKLLLVTNRGFARAYPLASLLETIEGPNPLQFDQPLPGTPFTLLGSQGQEQLLVILDSSRALRQPLADLPLRGQQLIKGKQGTRLVKALFVQPEDNLLLVTRDGYGKRQPVNTIPEVAPGKRKGRLTVSRRQVSGVALEQAEDHYWLGLADQFWPIEPERFPLEDSGSSRSYRLSIPVKKEIETILHINK